MSYASNADLLAEELRESLSEDDIEHLRVDLEQLGIANWMDWADDIRHEANDYLRATEKQRAKKKKWQEPVLRRRLTLIAYHQARLAASMLNAAASLGPGGGYRATAAYAASLGHDVMREGEWRWPFAHPDPPSGWPGPRAEPWMTATVIMKPGGGSLPAIIRQGIEYS